MNKTKLSVVGHAIVIRPGYGNGIRNTVATEGGLGVKVAWQPRIPSGGRCKRKIFEIVVLK